MKMKIKIRPREWNPAAGKSEWKVDKRIEDIFVGSCSEFQTSL
jgi:hypothetical protein